MYEYERSYGKKYDSNLGTREIAAKVREDIKAAVKAGELPKAKYSVRMQRFSGGSSIDVRISNVEEPGFVVLNLERLTFEKENPHKVWSPGYDPERPHNRSWMSHEAFELLKKVETILQAYNHDGSDIQSDYFDVKFYGHAEYDSAWTNRERERLLAADAVEVSAPKVEAHVDFISHLLGGAQ